MYLYVGYIHVHVDLRYVCYGHIHVHDSWLRLHIVYTHVHVHVYVYGGYSEVIVAGEGGDMKWSTGFNFCLYDCLC